MRKAIIFGITGQDGYYLNKLLKNNGIEVIGVSRTNTKWITGDIADCDFVNNLIEWQQPEYVFQFAANSTMHHGALYENHAAITTGTINLLEAIKNYCPTTKLFIPGSALQFKISDEPINENTPFHADSPYALARINSVYATRYFREQFNIKAYIGYFFHHDSPLRSERHVNQKIAQAVRRIGEGSDEKLILGDITVRKEFNFAGDIMEAIWIMINQNNIFEAVIGSGETYSIEQYLQYCFDLIGKKWQDYVEIDKSFISPHQCIASDPKLLKSLGWRPAINLKTLAKMMIFNQ